MDQSPPISMVSYTHFGYYKDLKSLPTFRCAHKLAETNLLKNLYVVDVADSLGLDPELLHTPIPGGKTIPRAIYLAEMLSPFDAPDARKNIVKMLDWLVSRKISEEKSVHLFPEFGRTAKAATERDVTTVTYASDCHPTHVLDLYSEEANRLNTPIAIPTGRLEQRLRTYEHTDYVLYLSEYAGETFLENGFAEDQLIKVGPLGTDTSEFTPGGTSEEDFLVIAVANVKPLKGIDYLLDAWEMLNLEDARLVICGTITPGLTDRLKPRIDDIEGVEHLGYVDDIESWYRRASVLVQPSLSEGFGKTVTEAMASQIPVIITEHGPREIVDDAGFVVPIRDAKAIAEKIQYVHDNPAEAGEMGRRGRDIVEANTWEAFSERVKDAHVDVLQREGHV